MQDQILDLVYKSKKDMVEADKLIRKYMPFIKSETSIVINRVATDQDDEVSIAMIGFHEAISSYDKNKGAFLPFAALIMRNRIIDYYRKESKHKDVSSIDEQDGNQDVNILETLKDDKNQYQDLHSFHETKKEILEFSDLIGSYGITLTDVAENSPKQARTLETCREVIKFAMENPFIVDLVVQSGRLPIKELVNLTNVSKKTLERHRKYLIAMILIQSNGYEIIRQHLGDVLDLRGGASN